jgi:hypothetical protein
MPYRSINHASIARPRPVKIEDIAINCWVSRVIWNPEVDCDTFVPPEVVENIVASSLQV